MTVPAALLDTDILSEVIKRQDVNVQRHAQVYLADHGLFQFSIITRYEILRGLKAKNAIQQALAFDRQGAIIGDADILIAATALVHDLTLVTGNLDHFRRIPNLRCETWRSHP
ncbi:MAG TPA: type II toxin-antitoxin system VapC family toxin [Thermoanaerobaculia bacterium]|jgi:tRNA(fMet)-specific endonuclease VapC